MKYTPIDDDHATEAIGISVHTGLRKGTEAPESHDLWIAIRDSDQAWGEAVEYAIWWLRESGLVLCAFTEEEEHTQ